MKGLDRETVEDLGEFANYWQTSRGHSGVVLGVRESGNKISEGTTKRHTGIQSWCGTI